MSAEVETPSTSRPAIAWARAETVKREIAEVPDKMLYAFAASHPADIIKCGRGGKNGTLLFRTRAILDWLEALSAERTGKAVAE